MDTKTHFHFKQFSLQHDRCTMKVGTDAVLLGAWANITDAKRILDIGTGCAVIPLMLAQRTAYDVKIDGVEIRQPDCEQAMENVRQSPWPTKVSILNLPIQAFHPPETYDMIISNPPYFNNSQHPPDRDRLQARHTVTLDYDSLLAAIRRLLKQNGRFNVILPYHEGNQFMAMARHYQFFCTRRFSFRARAEKPIVRWLLEFANREQPIDAGEVLHYNTNSTWSERYISLTRDYYLKL